MKNSQLPPSPHTFKIKENKIISSFSLYLLLNVETADHFVGNVGPFRSGHQTDRRIGLGRKHVHKTMGERENKEMSKRWNWKKRKKIFFYSNFFFFVLNEYLFEWRWSATEAPGCVQESETQKDRIRMNWKQWNAIKQLDRTSLSIPNQNRVQNKIKILFK